MANYVSGPVLFVKGIVEDVLGKAKELLGTILGRSDISREGQAQQDKADAQRERRQEGSRGQFGSRRSEGSRRAATRAAVTPPVTSRAGATDDLSRIYRESPAGMTWRGFLRRAGDSMFARRLSSILGGLGWVWGSGRNQAMRQLTRFVAAAAAIVMATTSGATLGFGTFGRRGRRHQLGRKGGADEFRPETMRLEQRALRAVGQQRTPLYAVISRNGRQRSPRRSTCRSSTRHLVRRPVGPDAAADGPLRRGDPGVAMGRLYTDGAGNGTVTVSAPRHGRRHRRLGVRRRARRGVEPARRGTSGRPTTWRASRGPAPPPQWSPVCAPRLGRAPDRSPRDRPGTRGRHGPSSRLGIRRRIGGPGTPTAEAPGG